MPELNQYDLKWCVRRLPSQLRSLIKKEEIVVAGGFIRSSIGNTDINDIDLFIPDRSYAKDLVLSLVDGKEKKLVTTLNAITIKGLKHTVRFITRWIYDSPIDVLSSFDFTICQAAFWWDHYCQRWASACSDGFYQDLAAKRLIYTNPVREEEPGGSMLRVLKYYQKGFRITMTSFADIITRLSSGVRYDEKMVGRNHDLNSAQYKKIVLGLLRDVDPNIDPDHIIHED
ncbi:MAG: hypothetical protein WA151_13930 [Desulfatirhabdiaceae bacterium]